MCVTVHCLSIDDFRFSHRDSSSSSSSSSCRLQINSNSIETSSILRLSNHWRRTHFAIESHHMNISTEVESNCLFFINFLHFEDHPTTQPRFWYVKTSCRECRTLHLPPLFFRPHSRSLSFFLVVHPNRHVRNVLFVKGNSKYVRYVRSFLVKKIPPIHLPQTTNEKKVNSCRLVLLPCEQFNVFYGTVLWRWNVFFFLFSVFLFARQKWWKWGKKMYRIYTAATNTPDPRPDYILNGFAMRLNEPKDVSINVAVNSFYLFFRLWHLQSLCSMIIEMHRRRRHDTTQQRRTQHTHTHSNGLKSIEAPWTFHLATDDDG